MVRSATSGEKSLVDQLRACQRVNKRCADCPERGPTYICLDFHTFVCQTCSGIHREFGHKIKSISLSEWSAYEVECVEAGGNERAAREWMAGSKDQEEAAEPDGTDLGVLREFIRLKYREQRWRRLWPPAGESGPAQPELPGPPAAPASPPEVDLGDLLSGEPSDLRPIRLPVSATSQPVLGPGTGDCREATVPEELAFQWIADFSCLEDGTSSQPAIPCEKTPDGSEASTADGTPSDDGDDRLKDVNDVPTLPQQLQDSDSSTAGTKSPVGELAEPSEGLEGQDSTLAERLREAVLRGSGDEIKQLFQRCLEPKIPPRRELSPDHYAAFDELISATPESSQTPAMQMAQVPQPMAPSLPTNAGKPTSVLLAPGEPLMPQQVAELMPHRDGSLTPQELARMSPEELVRVQVMVEHALKARGQPMSWPVPTSLPDVVESSPDEQTPFGDLLLEFHQRNPIAGLTTRS